ncbi:hypothetical protein [Streptomyces sp. NBC_00539]|uniref:hypothetical protein n=1 Tax=Streptomyces sp. NBC_00539 TaxID=2975770 RepID=UPI002E81F062|nr:hypothetical protein [Streptomyces sp. NBC_00539]WUC63035.1 hypothetical protein OG861_01790 [Streptomyces sp. NBC_00539]
MAFGKNRQDAPFEAVHWDEITQFTVGRMMRRTVRKSKRGEGPHAVRFMRARGGDEYMVPGVYIVPAEPAGPLAKGGFRLFEDEGGRQLLCTVLPDRSDRFRVTDATGRELGSVHRTPTAKRLTQQSLWMEQPGHPAIVAPRNWARGGPGAALGRGVGRVLGGVVDSLLSFGSDEAGSGADLKPVVWVAGAEGTEGEGAAGEYGQAVLTFPRSTEGKRWYFVERDGWLDKRLAFALAVLRESETLGADHR